MSLTTLQVLVCTVLAVIGVYAGWSTLDGLTRHAGEAGIADEDGIADEEGGARDVRRNL
ncbi:hypothetical protein OHA72_04635 [Dactylosporangium sp. NBC_01737]|uniref:hypothetical protein n=1 Tax=Dactylosporangium sp. NBC_01737 TaxID=2975959 RepID=UPI002E0FC0DD|nr:hypothetical protein OHA72_04635 [Dactylosporangium sp. NBC_01737]